MKRKQKDIRSKLSQRLLGKKDEGFTILEVMIALIVLSIGLLGLGALQLVAIKGNSFSSEMTYATMLAQQQAETLKNHAYTDADLTQGTHSAVGSSKGVQYTVTWNVTDNTPDTNMKTVNLTVRWTSLRQGTQSEADTVTARLRTIIRNI